jgi:tetratricopeptide (TPR) repeat protein
MSERRRKRDVRRQVIVLSMLATALLAAFFFLQRSQRRSEESPFAFSAKSPRRSTPHRQIPMLRATRDRAPAEQSRSLEEAAQREPHNFEAQVRLGDSYYDAGRHEAAVDVYRRALALNDSAYVRTNLGVSLHSLRRTDEALLEFEKALAIDADYWKATFNQLVIFANRREYDKALERLRSLRRLARTHDEIPPLDDLEAHLRNRSRTQ